MNSEYSMNLKWHCTDKNADFKSYQREHLWSFPTSPNEFSLTASASPDYFGNANYVNPEQTFIAALASCHCLTFLAIAYKYGCRVISYEDNAVGILAKANGTFSISRINLQPHVIFSEGKIPSHDDFIRFHDIAHKTCFIANSINSEVVVKPVAKVEHGSRVYE